MTSKVTGYLYGFVLLILPMVGNVSAQEAQADADWPCIQAYVPEVMLAVYWPVSAAEDMVGTWREDATVRALAERLGSLEDYDEEHRSQVDEWLASVNEGQHETVLNQLAEGVLEVANRRRSSMLTSIRGYTRQQISMAENIEKGLNQLADMEAREITPTDPERRALEENLGWQERVFDQRERSMIALCDQPVAVEQVLSDVLRDLVQRLP